MAGSSNSIPPSPLSRAVTQSSSSNDSSAAETIFGGRKTRSYSPSQSLVTSTTNSGASKSADFSQTNLGERTVSENSDVPSLLTQSSSAPIPPRGELDLENGGKIIFERVNGGDLPTAKDGLRSQLHDMEKSGKIDGESKSKMEKFLSGANSVMDFVMHNKKFQTAVGLIGCGACIVGGAFCPVLLLGVGPFILIFANGFIDNPMLTAPEGQGTRPPPTLDNTKKTNSDDGDSSKKSKPSDDDSRRPPSTGGASDADSYKLDAKKRKEMDEERKAEELRKALSEKLKQQNGSVSSFKVRGAPHGPEVQRLLNGLEESKRLSGEERQELINFHNDREGYIAAQSLEGGPLTPEEEISAREAIGARIGHVVSRFQTVATNPASSATDLAPTAEELVMIKNALTRATIDELFAYSRKHGRIPTQQSKLKEVGLSTQQLLDRAATTIGLPITEDSQGSLIHRVLGGYIEDYQKELNEWCGNAGISLPVTSDSEE
ncbi:hypothetical protein [Sansalvadorimonas verongulae]|uniref:hypothetical protein n=1 Tax=Sansalvadorimonas verongulae TaxID=2172824 RepID=UPI0012BD7C23|nr:hypothetical protein [Sansalvadorimonas verongulae]MTI14147.1 hypothetical protein [Sansalvadorimonas verongulae]